MALRGNAGCIGVNIKNFFLSRRNRQKKERTKGLKEEYA
jgi:hypothetical protein